MNTTTWTVFLQSISIRLIVLCFLILLLYSLWTNYVKPFLKDEQTKQALDLQKLEQSNSALNNQILQQQAENTKKKELLLSTKQLFLLWHERRLKAAQIEQQTAADELQNYVNKTEEKHQRITRLQQKSLEVDAIINQLNHNARKAYQGNAGSQRLQNILKDLEGKVQNS